MVALPEGRSRAHGRRGAPEPPASGPRSAPCRATRHAPLADAKPHLNGASGPNDAPFAVWGHRGGSPPPAPLEGARSVATAGSLA